MSLGIYYHITPPNLSLPYAVRFRQCMLEFKQSGWNNPRPFANALKYFSAFPVILLSAAQKNVLSEVAAAKGVTVQDIAASGERWFGEHPVFRMWLLAVLVNSMFSFWWDIEMDWGLALCEVDTWFGSKPSDSSPARNRRDRDRGEELSLIARFKRLFNKQAPIAHQRSPMPTPSPSFQHFPNPQSSAVPFGLRRTLLLHDPAVYYTCALIDLFLRFTWSLKLSSHLHTISEFESGVFMMEALELVRRWMWVFVRVEWEAVKMGETKGWSSGLGVTQGDLERVETGENVMWEHKGESG